MLVSRLTTPFNPGTQNIIFNITVSLFIQTQVIRMQTTQNTWVGWGNLGPLMLRCWRSIEEPEEVWLAAHGKQREYYSVATICRVLRTCFGLQFLPPGFPNIRGGSNRCELVLLAITSLSRMQTLVEVELEKLFRGFRLSAIIFFRSSQTVGCWLIDGSESAR